MLLYICIILTYTELFFLIKSILSNRKSSKHQTNSTFTVHGKTSIANNILSLFLVLSSIGLLFIPSDILNEYEDGVMTVFFAGCVFNAFMIYNSSRRFVVNGDSYTSYTMFRSSTYSFRDTYIHSKVTTEDGKTVWFLVTNREGQGLFTVNANWRNIELFCAIFNNGGHG